MERACGGRPRDLIRFQPEVALGYHVLHSLHDFSEILFRLLLVLKRLRR